jgi:hypothetical protein
VSDVRGLDLIAQQIVRDGRSLLLYVGQADLYTPPHAHAARRRLESLAHAEANATGQLIRFLQQHHATPPLLGAFPSGFTTINFTSLAHLMPALMQEEERSIAALTHGLAQLPDGSARHLLSDYLEMKRRHLSTLAEIRKTDTHAERQEPSVIPSTHVQPAH